MKQKYSLPFRSLPEGKHEFDYLLEDEFFRPYDELLEFSGKLDVEVVFLKQDSKQMLEVAIQGDLATTCDRCLESMVLKFKGEGTYYLREREEGEEEKEDVVFVERDEQKLELSQLFYEMLMLNLPQVKMHNEQDCNAEMLERLDELQEHETKVEIDPRWAELEKLKRKDK